MNRRCGWRASAGPSRPEAALSLPFVQSGISHLSKMHVYNPRTMTCRIYESYRKAGLLADGGSSTPASRPGTAGGSRPTTAPSAAAALHYRYDPQPAAAAAARQAGSRGPARAQTLPPRAAGMAAAAAEAEALIAAVRPAAEAPRPDTAPPASVPSFVRRHVQNSRAALKVGTVGGSVSGGWAARLGGGWSSGGHVHVDAAHVSDGAPPETPNSKHDPITAAASHPN